MPPPKQGKTKVATKKKSRPGGPRPGAGRPPKVLTASQQAAKETAYTELALKDHFKKDGIK